MEAEFCLICGNKATKRLPKIGQNMFPCKILEHGGVEEETNKSAMLKPIQIMEKSFHPLGAAAKSDAVFTIHEVCACVRAHMHL